MSRPLLDALPTFRVCRHPGCTNRMWKGSGTYDAGLCRDHGGQRIGRAQVQAFVPPVEKPQRDGVRVAEVPTGGSGYSGAEMGAVRVSLRAEPKWRPLE